MRRAAFLAGLFLLLVPAARAQDDADAWTPGADLVGDLDAQAIQLRLRGASGPLDSYERYYRGTKREGRLFVEGYYGPFRIEGKQPDSDALPTHVHIVARASPSIANAGCRVVFLLYDVSAESLASVQCEGDP